MKKYMSLCAFALVSTFAQADCPPCAEQTICLRDISDKIGGVEFRVVIARKPGFNEENWRNIIGMTEDCAKMCQSMIADMDRMPDILRMMGQMAECCKMDQNIEGNVSIGAFTEAEEATRQISSDEACMNCPATCNAEVCPVAKSEEAPCCAQECPGTACAQNCETPNCESMNCTETVAA
jgi:hypothetical protein